MVTTVVLAFDEIKPALLALFNQALMDEVEDADCIQMIDEQGKVLPDAAVRFRLEAESDVDTV